MTDDNENGTTQKAVTAADSPAVAIAQTPQTLPGATKGETQSLYAWTVQRTPLLPTFGTRERLRYLRLYALHPRATLFQGTVANLGKRVASTPYEISGPTEGITHSDSLFRNAQYGEGYTNFAQRTVWNVMTSDIGSWTLIVGKTTPRPDGMSDMDAWRQGYDTAGRLWGAPSGLVVLDPLRCYPTGDPLFPVIYRDTHGQRHLLHYTRTMQILDNPINDESFPGWGLCALSRAIAVISQNMYMSRYIEASLDDKPKPGILTIGNISDPQWTAALDRYQQSIDNDELQPFGKTMILTGIDRTIMPEVSTITFSSPPQQFDYDRYTTVNAHMMATALGVDPQDVYPLQTGNLGSGTQTEILAAQARGKTEGFIRADTERQYNTKVLPRACEFSYRYEDHKQDLERAQVAQAQATTLQLMAPNMSMDEVRRYMVLVDETFKDVLTDESGQMRRLGDADPKPEGEAFVGDDAPVEDSDGTILPTDTGAPAVSSTALPAATGQQANGEEPPPENVASTEGLTGIQIQSILQVLEGVRMGETPPSVAIELLVSIGIDRVRAQRMVDEMIPTKSYVYKDWGATRNAFVAKMAALIAEHPTGVTGRRRYAVRLRALMLDSGERAYQDGLEEGGVDVAEMTIEDRETVQTWLANTSAFRSNLTSETYPRKLSLPAARQRAELWANKSLRDIYIQGRASAAKNKMVRWVLDPAKENCSTCLVLNGQVHRLSTFIRAGWYPGADKLECGGFKCGCGFVDAPGAKARGKLPKSKAFVQRLKHPDDDLIDEAARWAADTVDRSHELGALLAIEQWREK